MALAAFLAELSQASHNSALVFDDPVSSLDHWHRQNIADRLVEEAKNRQIIVFTHEVMFLNDLLFFADEAKQTPHVLTVQWSNDTPGRHIDGLPWDNKKPMACLDVLDKDQAAIAIQWNKQPNDANIASMRDIYSRLRSTIERIVEFELLSDVTQRFRSYINTGKVKILAGITKNECDEIGRLLQKCHDLTNAHATSTAPIPKPVDLKKDLYDARQLIATIKARKSTIK
jgi:hypothetical protein